MAFQNEITGGQGALERPAIKSPGYTPGVSGWSINRNGSAEFNSVTIRGGESVDGTALYYTGTPGPGTLVASIAAVPGTDAFGNPYPAGVASMGGGTGSQPTSIMDAGLFRVSNAAAGSAFDGVIEPLFPTGGVQVSSGTGSLPDGVVLVLLPGTAATGTGQSHTPRVTLTDAAGTSAVDLQVSGTVLATNPVGTVATWQTPSYNPGWAAGPSSGSVSALQYRLDGLDNVIIEGTCHTTSATPNAVIFNLPTGYRPTAGPGSPNRRRGAIVNQAGTVSAVIAEVDGNGNVFILPNLATSGSDVMLELCIPLGHIS